MSNEVIIRVENLGKRYRIQHNAERQRYTALRDVLAQKFGAPFRALFRKNGSGSAGVSPALFGVAPKAGTKPSPGGTPAVGNRASGSETTARRDGRAPQTSPLRADRGEGQGEVSKISSSEDFWALKDVSFEVKQGDVVGIIGRNGAGKSTLLKILSRITEPTSGRVHLKGRVASLLEVGTGFHPELTGRENVFLNGAILGMSRAEIRQKFDEIVAFAEVEKFLDTPVKRYSSGMYVRLAFAVAAHLEPEILIVDEVLAVGDAQFQKKCLGKMKDVAGHGRTVLFVSHNMQAVSSLCNRAVLIDQGLMLESGHPSSVIANYIKRAIGFISSDREQIWEDPTTAPGNDRIRLRSIKLVAQADDPLQEIHLDTPIRVEVEYWNLGPPVKIELNLCVYSIEGSDVFEDWTAEEANWHGKDFPRGLFRTTCQIPGNLLNEGTFRVRILFFDSQTLNHLYNINEAVVFSVVDVGERAIAWHSRFIGSVHPKLQWSTELVTSNVEMVVEKRTS
jgi:lipopolysaccharide transport system ATP-binding protein